MCAVRKTRCDRYSACHATGNHRSGLWHQYCCDAPAMMLTVFSVLTLALANPAAQPSDFRASLERELDAQVARAEVLLDASALYKEAERLNEQGRRKEARETFVQARSKLLESNETDFYQPVIYAYFIKISNRLAELGGGSVADLDLSTVPRDGRQSIERFLTYFQGDGKKLVREALERLEPNEAMFRETFRAEKVPESLIYLGLVESGFDPNALSPAGALGTWQLVRGTGARYGLQHAAGGDERTDLAKSTRAAARYLSDLNRMFDDWLLALAAYNAGEYRILRIMKKTGIRDFWELRRRGLLPSETSEYVPAVLAAVRLVVSKAGTMPRTVS